MSHIYNAESPIFAICKADYMAYPHEMALIDKINLVTEQFTASFIAFYNQQAAEETSAISNSLSDDFTFDKRNLLILWENISIDNYFGDLNERAIFEFCKYIKTYRDEADEDIFFNQLFITSPNDLAMNNVQNFYRRLYLIFNETHFCPCFMNNNDIFENDIMYHDKIIFQNGAPAYMDKFIRYSIYFSYFIKTTEGVLKITNQLPDVLSYESDFISHYFRWQAGETTINEIREQLRSTLGNDKEMSMASFYRLVELLETNPLYQSFLVYHPEIFDKKRIGKCDNITEFIEFYSTTVKDENDIDGKLEVCRKYNYASLEELERNYLSFSAKFNSKRRKNK